MNKSQAKQKLLEQHTTFVDSRFCARHGFRLIDGSHLYAVTVGPVTVGLVLGEKTTDVARRLQELGLMLKAGGGVKAEAA